MRTKTLKTLHSMRRSHINACNLDGDKCGLQCIINKRHTLEHDKSTMWALWRGRGGSGFEHSHGELIELPLKRGRQKGQFGWGSGLGRGYISTAHYGWPPKLEGHGGGDGHRTSSEECHAQGLITIQQGRKKTLALRRSLEELARTAGDREHKPQHRRRRDGRADTGGIFTPTTPPYLLPLRCYLLESAQWKNLPLGKESSLKPSPQALGSCREFSTAMKVSLVGAIAFN